ncbi:MAG: hypothetical protein ACK56I_27995, partial [bacterium]
MTKKEDGLVCQKNKVADFKYDELLMIKPKEEQKIYPDIDKKVDEEKYYEDVDLSHPSQIFYSSRHRIHPLNLSYVNTDYAVMYKNICFIGSQKGLL